MLNALAYLLVLLFLSDAGSSGTRQALQQTCVRLCLFKWQLIATRSGTGRFRWQIGKQQKSKMRS